eukprot:s1007_g7.t1
MLAALHLFSFVASSTITIIINHYQHISTYINHVSTNKSTIYPPISFVVPYRFVRPLSCLNAFDRRSGQPWKIQAGLAQADSRAVEDTPVAIAALTNEASWWTEIDDGLIWNIL